MAIMPGLALAQFAPAQDQPGTTAMHADSTAFVAWATGCVAEPGPMNISNPSAGVAGAGWPAQNAIGFPQGTMGVTCLGDGGSATLTFDSPICNGEGPDFAVFENGFKSGSQWFLEIAFVEVSSDGDNFFRFPAITLVPKPLITPWITRLPTEMKLCCKVLGTAMTMIFFSSAAENSGVWPIPAVSARIRPSTTAIASAQLIPWPRKVAQATPSTPMPKAETNRISIPILAVEDSARKIKGVRESPSAANVPVATL